MSNQQERGVRDADETPGSSINSRAAAVESTMLREHALVGGPPSAITPGIQNTSSATYRGLASQQHALEAAPPSIEASSQHPAGLVVPVDMLSSQRLAGAHAGLAAMQPSLLNPLSGGLAAANLGRAYNDPYLPGVAYLPAAGIIPHAMLNPAAQAVGVPATAGTAPSRNLAPSLLQSQLAAAAAMQPSLHLDAAGGSWVVLPQPATGLAGLVVEPSLLGIGRGQPTSATIATAPPTTQTLSSLGQLPSLSTEYQQSRTQINSSAAAASAGQRQHASATSNTRAPTSGRPMRNGGEVRSSTALSTISKTSNSTPSAASTTFRRSRQDKPPELTGRPSVPIALDCDEQALTEYQCLLRKQIELFEAGPADVRGTAQGRNTPITMGQVGIRCRHCASITKAARARGATFYSKTIDGIYQVAQNMSKVHLCQRCHCVPEDVKRKLQKLRTVNSRASGGKEYWSEGIRALGVFNDGEMLRFTKEEPPPNAEIIVKAGRQKRTGG